MLGPVILISLPCLIAISLESSGAPLFAQRRLGKGQRPFTLLKMRSMSKDTENRGSHEVSAAHITRMGHFIRRTKLDELPQVWNVLLGQMSFVGPRPCLPNQTELINERVARGVFSVLPGVTGPAQLSGIDMSTPRRLAEVDAAYIANRTTLGDLRLIMITATGKGKGDAVKP